MKPRYDPTDLAGQERAKAEEADQKRIAQEVERNDTLWLMSTDRGRRIVWRLLEEAGVFRSSFNQTAMTMAFNEGNRNFGLKVLATIHAHCPELYPEMLKENTDVRNDGTAAHPN